MLLLSLFQELSILQDLDDARGECRAHGNLGAVHLSLSNYINAMKCYQEQLDKAVRKKNVKDYLNEFVLLDNYFAFFEWHYYHLLKLLAKWIKQMFTKEM